MKKVLSFGLAAVFSLAILATACSEDDEKCTTCTDDGKEYEVCWEKGKVLDMTAELLDFALEHPNADCEEVDNP